MNSKLSLAKHVRIAVHFVGKLKYSFIFSVRFTIIFKLQVNYTYCPVLFDVAEFGKAAPTTGKHLPLQL